MQKAKRSATWGPTISRDRSLPPLFTASKRSQSPSSLSPVAFHHNTGDSSLRLKLPDTSLWQEALSQLPKQVQIEIVTSNKAHRELLQDIVNDVEAKKDTCIAEKWTLKWRGETIAVRDIAERISTSVNRFVAIGDQVAQYDPAHFGLPWAGVRFLLVVAASNQQAISNALVGTEYITSCLSRCAIYELLYLNSTIKLDSSGSLRKSLVGLYRGILLFLVKAKKYLAHSTARRIASNIGKGDEFSTLLADVEKQEQVVRLNADNADAEYMRSVGASVTGIRGDLRDLRDLLSSLPIPLAVISLKVDALAITTNETHNIVTQIHSELDAFDATFSRQEKEKLVRSISDKDQTERYRALRDAHQSGSAFWLPDIEDVKSLTYRTSTRSQIVWVQGKPGIGKSVQMATFSKMLKDDFSSSTSLVEYYVTNSDNEKYRTSKEILRSVLAQLYIVTGDTPIEDKSQLREARLKTASSSMSDLPNEQVIRLIVQQLKKMGNVSILIDALDECSDCQQAALAFRQIVEEVEDPKLQILITSRDHIRPLRTAFRKHDHVKIFDVHEWRSRLNDVIRLYCNLKLDEMVKSGTFAVELEPTREKEISAAVVENAEGMILYAKLFLRELSRVSTKNELLSAIERPPVGFRDLLIQWAKRIESDESRLGTLPIRVCQWVLSAKRQMTLSELREAVSIEASQTRWDEGNFPDSELILESCAGIVETDEKNVVRFVHASVREFFEGPSPFGPDEWATGFFASAERREIILAQQCLTYLDFDDFDCGGSKTPVELLTKFSKYKFLEYAARNWAKHLQGEGEHQCKKEFRHFLSMSEAKLTNWCECFYMTAAFLRENGGNATQAGHLSYDNMDPMLPNEALDMHLTAIFGLDTLFDEMESKAEKAVSITKRGSTPLHQALDWRNVSIARKLIPLSTAIINHQSSRGWTPINLATMRDMTAEVKALGTAGAHTSLTAAPIPTPLLHASQWGYLATVEVLLELGASPNEQSGEHLEVPLHGACKAGFLGVAERLMDAGASIFIENKIGLTPFHSSCFRGDIALIELLLRSHDEEAKREIVLRPQGRVLDDLQYDEILTPIAMADSAEAKKKLLDYGADPSVTNKWGRNALEYSVHHSNMEVLKGIFKMPKFKACMNEDGQVILADDAVAPEGMELVVHQNVPPICILALWNAHVDKVELLELLVQEGASLNRQDEHGRHLLHSASLLGCEDVVQFLIDKHIDLNTTDEFGNSPLHYAALGERVEITRLLLDGGAKWDLMNSIGAAAFHAVGNVEVLKVHLDHGADIRLPSRAGADNTIIDPYSYCVSMAARGHLEVLKFIYETFPGIFQEEANSFDPLVHAMLRKHSECVDFLLPLSDLTKGFKNLGMGALHCAAEFGREGLLRKILEAYQERGLSLDAKDNDEDTPLHTAILNAKLEAFTILLKAGADPLIPFRAGAINENSGVTVLMAFGRSEYEDRDTHCVAFAEAVLEDARAGELLEMKDSDGMTALHYACHSPTICKMLLEKGANVGAQMSEGSTPLHMAAYFARGENAGALDYCSRVFCLLLEAGADPDIMENGGLKPEDYLHDTYPLKTEMKLRWALAKRREGPWLEVWLKQMSWITLPALAVGALAAKLLVSD